MDRHLIETLTWSLEAVRKQTLLEVQDLLPGQFLQQAHPGEHHPSWVLGHLLLADSYLLHLLAVEDLPADFPDLISAHGPESVPGPGASTYLPADRLVERLERVGETRVEAVAGADPAALQCPMPDQILARSQPTLGHHVQSLVFHEGHHGGQLACWRRRRGLAPAPWVFSLDRTGRKESGA